MDREPLAGGISLAGEGHLADPGLAQDVGEHLLGRCLQKCGVDGGLLQQEHFILQDNLIRRGTSAVRLCDIAGKDFVQDAVVAHLDRRRIHPVEGYPGLELLCEADLRPVEIGGAGRVDLHLYALVETIGPGPDRDLRIKQFHRFHGLSYPSFDSMRVSFFLTALASASSFAGEFPRPLPR